MSEVRRGKYGWELRQGVILIGETPRKSYRNPPDDMLVLKTCRLVRRPRVGVVEEEEEAELLAEEEEEEEETELSSETELLWDINLIPMPRLSTLLNSDSESTQFFDTLLYREGIQPTPTHNHDHHLMIDHIISLARSITNIDEDVSTSTANAANDGGGGGTVGMEFPVIEARIWDADDAEAREEVVSRSRMPVDEYREVTEHWFVSSPIESLQKGKDRFSEEEDKECECSICLRELGVGQRVACMPCFHQSFHFKCTLRWLQIRNICPLCRMPIQFVSKVGFDF